MNKTKLLGAVLGTLALGTANIAHADDAPKPAKDAKPAKEAKKGDKGKKDAKGGEKSCSGDKGCSGKAK